MSLKFLAQHRQKEMILKEQCIVPKYVKTFELICEDAKLYL